LRGLWRFRLAATLRFRAQNTHRKKATREQRAPGRTTHLVGGIIVTRRDGT
jgi:hypothetical protein